MPAWIRVVAAAAAALPLFWTGTAYTQSGAREPSATAPIARSLDCYERLPTDPVNLALREASTQSTLRLLAQNYRVNMVVTDDVTGSITLDFYRAPVRDVFQGILDANGLVCVKQGELLRVSTSERIVRDEKGRADALVSSATRDADISKRVSDANKQAAEAAIQFATTQFTRRDAEIQAKRGEIKQEIIRLKYQDPAIVARTVAAMVGIGPNVVITACRLKKQDGQMNAEPLDVLGGGGVSAATEAERTAVNLARASAGALGSPSLSLQPGPAGPGVTGPPGGLGALPPFSALFGPQPPPPPPAPGPLAVGSGLGGFGAGETSPTVRTDCPSNSIVLRLYDEQMRRVKEAIENQFDVLPPQIKIESRMELLNRSDLSALGVQWGGGGLLAVNQRTAIVGRGFTSNQPIDPSGGIAPLSPTPVLPNAPLNQVIPVFGTTGLPNAGNLVNLPISSLLGGAAAGGAGGFNFGIISNNLDLNLTLEALATQDRSQSLARPEVVVADNQRATVEVGQQIPYATVSSAGTNVQFVNAVLRLQVTPSVVCKEVSPAAVRSGGTHRLRMLVRVENDTVGVNPVTTTLGSPPPINVQKAETDMNMSEGQRLVIGGITQTSAEEQTRKVPLMGDIPILGWLFKQKGKQSTKSELVVFLTPTVLASQAPQEPPACPAPVAVKAR